MTMSLARPDNSGLALPSAVSPAPLIPALSRYRPPSADGVLASDLTVVDSLATISAGKLVGEPGREYPQPARDGKICLHDPDEMAPGLLAELEARDYTSLIIGFAWNPTVNPDGSLDCERFVRSRMVRYARSRLEIVGDQHGLTVFRDPLDLACRECNAKPHAQCSGKRGPLATPHVSRGERLSLVPGTDDFEQAWLKCNPEYWVYFYLAAWTDDGPGLKWPDNTTLPYRLRFGGANSRRRLDSAIRSLVGMGQLAFMPIRISIQPKASVVLPNGTRGENVVWQFAPLVGPEGSTDISLISPAFLKARDRAREQSQLLSFSPPDDDAVRRALAGETRALADADIEATDARLALLVRGGPCDVGRARRLFFALARNTPAATEDGRHAFLRWHTKRHPDLIQTEHLEEFLQHATEDDVALLVDTLLDVVDRAKQRTADGEVIEAPSSAPTDDDAPPSSPHNAPSASPVDDAVDGKASDDTSHSSDASPLADANVEAECIFCATRGPCVERFDEHGVARYWCVDGEACKARVAAEPEAETEPEIPIAQAVNAWLLEVSARIRDYPDRDASPPRGARNRLGKVLMEAGGDDKEMGLHLLRALTGVQELDQTRAGHCGVVLAEADDPEWDYRVAQLRQVLSR